LGTSGGGVKLLPINLSHTQGCNYSGRHKVTLLRYVPLSLCA